MSRTGRISPTEIADVAADWIVRRDAGLTAAEEREFARWQSDDPRHAAAISQHERTWAVLDGPRQGGQADALLEQLGARAGRRRRRRVGVTAMTLGAALVAGVVWQTGEPPAGPPGATTVVASDSALVLPASRILPDGTVVELKVGAEMTVDFSGALRRVALRKGEAHFQVARNPARPFVVEAAGIEVRALGTGFSVQLGRDQIEVLVTEGRVAVEQPAGISARHAPAAPGPTRLATAVAGHRVLVALAAERTAAAEMTAVSALELNARLAWRAPRLEFSDTRLADAIAMINQHSARSRKPRFVVEDASLEAMRVSGFFRADNTETFVRLLEASFGIVAEPQGDAILLRKAR